MPSAPDYSEAQRELLDLLAGNFMMTTRKLARDRPLPGLLGDLSELAAQGYVVLLADDTWELTDQACEKMGMPMSPVMRERRDNLMPVGA